MDVAQFESSLYAKCIRSNLLQVEIKHGHLLALAKLSSKDEQSTLCNHWIDFGASSFTTCFNENKEKFLRSRLVIITNV